jgi:hypothetical protein
MAHHKRKKARLHSGSEKLDRERTARVEAKFNIRWMLGTPPTGYTLKKTRSLRRRNNLATRLSAQDRDTDRDHPQVPFKRSAHWDWW